MRVPSLSLLILALCGVWTPLVAEENTGQKFIVHEWGTFTTISGSDGKALPFKPDNSDLPDFVQKDPYQEKKLITSTVSLETPVLYAYAPKAMTFGVKVRFPNGEFTEWYPAGSFDHAKSTHLEWPKVEVLPSENHKLPDGSGGPRYYHARKTDAARLRVQVGQETQYEKFIFYRGAGRCEFPAGLTASPSGHFTFRNSAQAPVAALFLVAVQNKKVRFLEHSAVAAGSEASLQIPVEHSDVDKLADALTRVLVQEGMYKKEARAMVATWRDHWFEEDGTRVLYFVPRVVTEDFLPLEVAPKPDELARVMIGRMEIFTPEREAELRALMAAAEKGSPEDQREASKVLAKLGRLATPARARVEQLIQAEKK